jgi:large subunit ribosomal protein L18
MANDRAFRRAKTKTRIRGRISGTPTRPRLTVHRSNKAIYVQAIDDSTGTTLAAACSLDKELMGDLKGGANIAAAEVVGKKVAARLLEKGIEAVVFDRNGYLYHGRVKALADGARSAGLKF